MTDRIEDIPAPVSIQTGAGKIRNLIPIHEDAGYEIPATIKTVRSEFDQDLPDDALKPPPYSDECNEGNFADFVTTEESPDERSGGVRFDPSSNMGSMKQKSQYHIIDLFWLINPKLALRQEFKQDEAHFCQLSYNIDFGNLKATLFKIPNGALHGHVLFLMSLLRLTSGTIYPSALFKLIHESEKIREESETFTCLEQLVYNSGEVWQTQRPVCTFTVHTESIILTITDKKSGQFFYEFNDWQRKALIHSANFAINQGYVLTGNQNINS